MSKKLAALRAEMAKRGVDGFFVPHADEFQNEYPPPSAERIAWLTGFTGSSDWVVVLRDKAAFFTDGRYTLQSLEQVSAEDFQICSVSEEQGSVPTISPAAWIERNLPKGAVFAIDPWLHTPAGAKKIREAVEKAGGVFKFTEENPLDAVWRDRPAAPLTPCVPHPLEFSGKASAEKRAEVAAALRGKGAGALAVIMSDEICWLFNVRGNDIPHTPFALSYAILHDDGAAEWFIDPRKVGPETRAWVGPEVKVQDLAGFAKRLAELAALGRKIWIDPAGAPARLRDIALAGGGETVEEQSPIQLMKARKNATEVRGMINAHIRDGVAETRYLAAITAPGAAARLDEISASDMLEKFRSEGENFRELSFNTISGAGAHGAVVHYRATQESKKPLLAGPVYLVDSGGQYLDGTTDITRTVAVDPEKVTPEMRDRFTRVLKGHIQVAMSEFPEGTTGQPFDVKARAALKEIGLDYTHGTGHGVGSYLSVHEGPCRFDSRSTTPLEPGMIISNEPGYYKEGEYGIRIESLVTVIDTGRKDMDGKRVFALKTITQAPIDRNLIDRALLKEEERTWLNGYHKDVRETLLPLLDKIDLPAAVFLKAATAPI